MVVRNGWLGRKDVANVYTRTNYKTKKQMREAIAAGEEVRLFSPGGFPPKEDGTEYVEGPHSPAMHTWYASVVMKDGLVVKIKS